MQKPSLDEWTRPLSITQVWTPSFPMADSSIVLLETVPLSTLVVGAQPST